MKTTLVILAITLSSCALLALGTGFDGNLIKADAIEALTKHFFQQDSAYINAWNYNYSFVQKQSLASKLAENFAVDGSFIYVSPPPVGTSTFVGRANLTFGFLSLFAVDAGEARTVNLVGVDCSSLNDCVINATFVARGRGIDYTVYPSKLTGFLSEIFASLTAQVTRRNILDDFKIKSLYVQQIYGFIAFTDPLSLLWAPVTVGKVLSP